MKAPDARCLLLLGIAIAVGACATTQVATPLAPPPPVPRPSFSTGERWVFMLRSGTRSEIVYEGRRDETLVFRLTGTPPEGSRRPATVVFLSSTDLARITGTAQFTGGAIEYRPDNGALRFPLTVGKSWQHRYVRVVPRREPPEEEMIVDVTVKSYERIKVPAGPFGAFRVESTTRSVRDTEPALYATYWYAPAAKAVIKYQAEMPARGMGRLTIEGDELAELELKP